MPPQPNIPQKDHPNESSVGVASEGQFVFIESEDFNENSSGSDTGVDIENETEYAGYKLLQQDDGNNQTVDDANDSGSEESSFSDEDDCNDSVNKTVGIAFTKGASDAEVDINYKVIWKSNSKFGFSNFSRESNQFEITKILLPLEFELFNIW